MYTIKFILLWKQLTEVKKLFRLSAICAQILQERMSKLLVNENYFFEEKQQTNVLHILLAKS